jgi:hypothetical protein
MADGTVRAAEPGDGAGDMPSSPVSEEIGEAIAAAVGRIDRIDRDPLIRQAVARVAVRRFNLHVKLEDAGGQGPRGAAADPQGRRPARVEAGKVHAIMGPNGSGKSTLSYVLSGRDGYEVTDGTATLEGGTCWPWSRTSARRPACSSPSSTRWRSPASAT